MSEERAERGIKDHSRALALLSAEQRNRQHQVQIAVVTANVLEAIRDEFELTPQLLHRRTLHKLD